MDLVCNVYKKIKGHDLSHTLVSTSKGYFWDAIFNMGYGNFPDPDSDEYKESQKLTPSEVSEKILDYGEREGIEDIAELRSVIKGYLADDWYVDWNLE